MTSRERSARTKFYAVAAAAALASLALVGTLGLKSNRREPNRGAAAPPPSRPTAGIVGGGNAPSTEFPWMVTLYDGGHPDNFSLGPRRRARWRPSSSSSGTYPPPPRSARLSRLSCVSF